MEDGNMQAVIDAARFGMTPVTVDANAAHIVSYTPTHGYHETNSETGLPKPLRKRGSVVVFDAASFNMVLADNADAGDIAIYIDRNPTRPAVVAVLNGHGKTGAGWGDFRASIQFRKTPQWEKWTAIDGKMLGQAAFAEFIEDNLEDIADPAGATMLEIATYLEATRTTNFKSGIRLSSGQIQFQNLENLDAKVGAGQIAIPETITLGLAPVQGCPVYRVPARFRYRLTDGKLTLGVKLQRVEDLMASVLDDVVAKIERGANISVIEGIAPDVVR